MTSQARDLYEEFEADKKPLLEPSSEKLLELASKIQLMRRSVFNVCKEEDPMTG